MSEHGRELRLGMIGCGQISDRFFNQAAQLAGVRFVATCAAHEDRARAKAVERGCDRWYDDYRKLLEQPDIDGVVITTPHRLHAPMAADAARAGKHVLVEKPMATRWEEAVELVEAARKAGVVLMALPFVHNPTFLTALNYVNPDYLTKITGAEAELCLPGPPRSNWYYNRAIADGGAMLDTMNYPLARLAPLLGPAKRVTAFVNTLIPRRITGDGGRVHSDVDDIVTIVLEYASGQQAVIRSWWAQSYVQNGTVLHGRSGAIFMNRFGRPLVVKSDRTPVPGADPVEYLGLPNCYLPTVPAATVHDDIMAHFADCVRTGATPKCDGRIGLHVIEQMMMAYRSARDGRTIELQTTFDLWWPRDSSLMDLSQEWL